MNRSSEELTQILEPRQSFAKMQVGVMACLSPRECEDTPDLQHRQTPAKKILKRQGNMLHKAFPSVQQS